MALLFFFLAKVAVAYLPIALFEAWRPPFPFGKAQYVQVFPLKLASFCKLSAGPGSTNNSAIFLLPSSSLTLTFSLPLCPILRLSFLSQTLSQICLLFPLVLSGCNGSPDTRFSRETTRLMRWPNGECYSCLLQCLMVSSLLFLVSTLLFSSTSTFLAIL